ncbi:TetR/AcrR family transcriptional regulator [Antribacter gilvus]|uniref:TetR/AcrR family transcriptional regulator n=1 Tax=Antribacter gilvus TaxID=2304675 RepID=UPI000F78A932|nr:TetR/AcrR family transcriptional regulator [Antribacter gilvus]
MTARRRWLDEGLELLAESGPGGLTIDALCARLGLSKGSFYHHFKGMAGFKTALLEHYEERGAQVFIDLVESLPMADGAEKLKRLVEAAVTDETPDEVETQLRAWASKDAEAREHLERIDRKRTEYVRRQCRAVVEDADLADDVTQLIYLVLVGAGYAVPPLPVREQARLWNRLIAYLESEAGRAR